MERVALKIAGAAGEGVKTVGEIVPKAIKRLGYYVFGYREYPSLIRGGHNTYQIDFSNEKLQSSKEKADILVCLNKNSLVKELPNLESNAMVIYAGKKSDVTEQVDNLLFVDAEEIAQNIGGAKVMANTVLAGYLFAAMGFDLAPVKSILDEVWARFPDLLEKNLKVMQAGFDEFVNSGKERFNVNMQPTQDAKDKLVITGNESVGLSVIASGVKVYTAYPMTPSTTILHFVAKHGPKYGVQVNQLDDEISVVQATIAANFAGTRAVCGTSGGGMALMSESIGLSGLAEIPLVLIDAQRTGPATGLPTWHSQDDLRTSIGNTPADIPKVVVAPGDTKEAFKMLAESIDLAERYQIPVIYLTDKFLAETFYTQDAEDFVVESIDRGDLITSEVAEGYKRYDVTKLVNPRTIPGVKNGYYVASSDEHEERGHSLEADPMRNKMMEKRMKKMDEILKNLPDPEVFGPSDANLSLISWGSNKGPVLDAVNALNKSGKKVNFMHVKYVYPLKKKPVSEFLKNAKKSVLLECNYAGQFGEVIREATLLDTDEKILKYDGKPFFINELIEKLEVLL